MIDRAYIIRDKQGKAIRAVGAILDVTESRKMIKEIKKQNKTLKEIAWMQSHVVRAPLARLMGLVDLLKMGGIEEMSQHELRDHIFISACELDGVVKKIIKKTEILKK